MLITINKCLNYPLFVQFDPQIISTVIEEVQPKLCTYLSSSTVEARISAGISLAILHEIALKNIDNEFRFKYVKQFFKYNRFTTTPI